MKYYCIITSPDGSGWDGAAIVVDSVGIEYIMNYRAAFQGVSALVKGLISLRLRGVPYLFLDDESLPEELRDNQAAYNGWCPWTLTVEQEKALTERPIGFSALVVSEAGWAFDIVEKHTENSYYTPRFEWESGTNG